MTERQMTQEPVITKWTCEHIKWGDLDTITRLVHRPSQNVANPSKFAQLDWDFALEVLAKRTSQDTPGHWTYPDHLEVIQICSECAEFLPSIQHRMKAQKQQTTPAEVDTSELQDVLDSIESGDALYYCSGCAEFKKEDDLVELRECPHCEEVFDGNEGRNCPSCNRPFTRNLEVMGCSDCLDSDSPPEPATIELLKSMMGGIS